MALLAATTPRNTPEFTVTELGAALKRTVEDAYGHIRVRGEISGWKKQGSGHCYFCLKDTAANLDGVMWRGPASALAFRPEDGLEVIATGKLSTYPGRSKYQLVVERMEIAGVGALLAQLERRRLALAAEGLFAETRKRKLPYLPAQIGVITSPTGAVIRDILHRLADRFPTPVTIWPVAVQGEGAAAQVVAAIAGFNAMPKPPALLIIARGGGSIEDLWPFNDEALVRAVAASRIPTISAVGHETDTTLCDLAADRRAPTPTAAAEMAVPVRADLRATVATLAARQDRCATRHQAHAAERSRAAAARLPRPAELTGPAAQRLDDAAARLPRGLDRAALAGRARLARDAAAFTPSLLTRAAAHAAQRLATVTTALTTAAATRHAAAARAATRAAAPLRPMLLTARAAAATARLTPAATALAAAAITRRRAATHALARPADRLTPTLLATRAATAHTRLAAAARLLETLSFPATLARGYAVVELPGGGVLATAAAARAHTAVTLRFADGAVSARLAAPRKSSPERGGGPPAQPVVEGLLPPATNPLHQPAAGPPPRTGGDKRPARAMPAPTQERLL